MVSPEPHRKVELPVIKRKFVWCWRHCILPSLFHRLSLLPAVENYKNQATASQDRIRKRLQAVSECTERMPHVNWKLREKHRRNYRTGVIEPGVQQYRRVFVNDKSWFEILSMPKPSPTYEVSFACAQPPPSLIKIYLKGCP